MKITKVLIIGLILTLTHLNGYNTVYAAGRGRETLVSLSFENADIRTVLRTFARLGSVNIVASQKVSGTITIQLEHVPWNLAFQTVLRVHGLTAVEEKDVIGVMTMEENKTQREIIGLETKVLRIRYGKASKMENSVSSMLTERGKVKIDERTNSLVVTDVPEALSRVTNLVNNIDTPTPQVMIEAKIVEIDHKIVEQLGVQWRTVNKSNSKTICEGGVSAPIPAAADFLFGTLLSTSIEPNVNVSMDLQTAISMLESQDKARILSQPKIAVMDNEEAMILSGKKIPIITLDRSGNRIIEFYDVALKLTVTPHINPEDQIVLDLHPEVSDVASEATPGGEVIILAQEARTTLLVDNNQTAVIGGIIREKTGTITTGVPYLSRIPLLGRLFKSVSKSISKTDLLILVTPSVIPVSQK